MTGTHSVPCTHGARERGAVLPIVLVAVCGVGALSLANVTKVLAQLERTRTDVYAARAQAMADGELEFAKNVVNASAYANGHNSALVDAAAASPPLIPGTSVRVTPCGDEDNNWFSLQATATYQGTSRQSQVFVRQAIPVSVYNYFVIDHKLGLTGSPRGKVHTNKSIDFFFPNGLYRDPVTASEGFAFVYGATTANTSFLSTWDSHAEPWDILAGVAVTDASKPDNTLNVTQPYIAEVALQKANATVRLYEAGHYISVPVQVPVSVFDHYVTVNVSRLVPVYHTITVHSTVGVYESRTENYTVQVPVYQTQLVPVTVYNQVWVVDPPPPPGDIGSGDLGGGATGGHWETVSSVVMQSRQVVVGYNTEARTRTIQVQIGTQQVHTSQQVVHHYDVVIEPRQVAVYRTEMQPQYQQQWVPEQLVSTQVVPADGVFYFEGPVRNLAGTLQGRLSVVSNNQVRITGSLQYVDASDNTRMSNGLDPAQAYQPNPAYHGNAVLGVLATGDIRYANTVPTRIEVNASLLSKNGTVAYQGIAITNNGETVGYAGDATLSVRLKESLRRLGGVVTRQRPVASYVAANGAVYAGFQRGASQMDRNLMVGGGGSLPFMFQDNKPHWTMHKAGRELPVH